MHQPLTPSSALEVPAMAGNPVENGVDLTLFVACYNEEENIVCALETVLAALREFDFTWELIIIDDGSTDRSVEVIEEFLDKHPGLPITLKKREANVGVGEIGRASCRERVWSGVVT